MSSLAILEGRTEPLRQQPYNMIGEDERAAVMRVMESRNLSGFLGRAGEGFLGGSEVRALDEEFARAFDVRFAVSFNSATTALQGAVAAAGIGPGDEVVTSPYTMSATATAVLLNGAVPVFADLSDATFCLDAASVEAAITSRARAILPVNLFGCSPDYDALMRIAEDRGLILIEDNAQGPGATYRGRKLGTIGDMGVFSFNVHKTIQCGEGGMVVTNNEGYAERLRMARNHGEIVVDDLGLDTPIVGSNYRLSELHAAIARVQLAKLDDFNTLRKARAEYLTKGLLRFPWIVPTRPPEDTSCVWYLYPFRYLSNHLKGVSRDTFARAMAAEGFPVPQGYTKPLYLQPLYQTRRMFPRTQFPFVSSEFPTDVSYDKGICPVVERLWEYEMLTTAVIHPPNTDETVDAFLDALWRIEQNADKLLELQRQV